MADGAKTQPAREHYRLRCPVEPGGVAGKPEGGSPRAVGLSLFASLSQRQGSP